ncbi:MAG: hypothetical protein AMS24_03990 [Chlamydiae bacterium SM23_39]|nr:MAG: hypothetical protein AMS24_03990 [Chlamydiae bacterium SM23_39]
MFVGEKKKKELKERMRSLNIFEKDLIEKFILSSGRGGQKIQKSHSAVYIKHIPTGLEIKCQKEREREINRYFARKMLCDLYEKKILHLQTKKEKLFEKKKKQKKRRYKRFLKKEK